MPQPLSRVKSNASLFISNNSFADFPDLAALLASIVEQSAHIDSWHGAILSEMLGASAEIGIAMYGSLSGAQAQRDVLAAVAQEKLSGDTLDLFAVVMKIAGSARKMRNAVVHGVWATSPDIPDGLVMIPGADYTAAQAKMSAAKAQNKEPIKALDDDRIYVYKLSDFRHVEQRVRESLSYSQHFFLSLADPAGQSHLRLWNEPEIAQEISRIQKGRQNTQAGPRQSPPTIQGG